jgi:uncharacterized protein
MARSTVDPAEALARHKVMAVVGASKNPEKDAHTVPLYMKEHGYTVIPINPTAPEIVGEKAYPSLADLPLELAQSVELVDVFRPSEELPQVARQVLELKSRTGMPVIFWAQLGLQSDEAASLLQEGGVPYVMDACMRVVHKLSRIP